MKIHIIILSIFLIIFNSVCYAEITDDDDDKKPKTDAMLFGDVKSNGEHIPFATIKLKGTTVGTAADATGHFKLTDLPVGKQVFVISAIGYKSKEVNVTLISKKGVVVLVELKPDNIGIEQVVVSADRNERSRKETPTIVNSINPKLFKRTQNVTLSDGLNFSPGLRMENNCQNCGFSQVRMNGLEGPYSQILINSRPVFSGLAGVYGLELIPANMIERVEVIRGGGSAMYGSNAIAGTINLITKDPITNSFDISSTIGTIVTGNGDNGSTDYNLNFNGSFVSDDYKTGVSIFGFTRNRKPFDANDDGFSEIPIIENTTLGTRVYQRVAERGKLTFDYFNINEFRRGGNKFELPIHEADITESVTHKINSGSLSFDLLMREADKFSAFFSAQGVDRDSYYGANKDLSAYGKTIDFTYTSGIQYIRHTERFLFSPATLTSGIEFNGSSLTDTKLGYYDKDNGTHHGNTLIADQTVSTQAGFLQSEWKMNDLIFTAGLRFDHYKITDNAKNNDEIKGNVFSPRISLMYNISQNLQLRTGFARGFRAPQIFDEDLHIESSGARKVIHVNDPELKQETSNSYTGSLDYNNFFGRWQFQFLVEGFYTHLLNPFVNVYGEPNENGEVIYTRTNAEKGAVVKGLNIELNASPSARLQFQSGFTIQNSKYEEPQEFNETKFFRSPDNYGYLSVGFNPSHEFSIACTGNYSGPMLVPYFGPQLANPEKGELRKTGSFFDAGLKLSYEIHLTEIINMQINGGIKNIFNSYQNDFDTGINRDPAYIYGPISPRTIYLGIKIGNLL